MQSCKIRYSSVKVRKILTFTISLTNLYKIYKTFRHIPAIIIPSELQRQKKFFISYCKNTAPNTPKQRSITDG